MPQHVRGRRDLRDEREREDFIARYMEELAAAYPIEPDGRVLFLYPRLFIVATKTDR